MDHQINYIVQQLRPSFNKLNSTADFDEKMSSLAYEMFDIAQAYALEIVNGEWMGKGLHEKSAWAWLGGITINVDGAGSDMFLPLTFGI